MSNLLRRLIPETISVSPYKIKVQRHYDAWKVEVFLGKTRLFYRCDPDPEFSQAVAGATGMLWIIRQESCN